MRAAAFVRLPQTLLLLFGCSHEQFGLIAYTSVVSICGTMDEYDVSVSHKRSMAMPRSASGGQR
jgi:hypothetical protein